MYIQVNTSKKYGPHGLAFYFSFTFRTEVIQTLLEKRFLNEISTNSIKISMQMTKISEIFKIDKKNSTNEHVLLKKSTWENPKFVSGPLLMLEGVIHKQSFRLTHTECKLTYDILNVLYNYCWIHWSGEGRENTLYNFNARSEMIKSRNSMTVMTLAPSNNPIIPPASAKTKQRDDWVNI